MVFSLRFLAANYQGCSSNRKINSICFVLSKDLAIVCLLTLCQNSPSKFSACWLEGSNNSPIFQGLLVCKLSKRAKASHPSFSFYIICQIILAVSACFSFYLEPLLPVGFFVFIEVNSPQPLVLAL